MTVACRTDSERALPQSRGGTAIVHAGCAPAGHEGNDRFGEIEGETLHKAQRQLTCASEEEAVRNRVKRQTFVLCAALAVAVVSAIPLVEAGSKFSSRSFSAGPILTNPGARYSLDYGTELHTNPGGKYGVSRADQQIPHQPRRQIRLSRLHHRPVSSSAGLRRHRRRRADRRDGDARTRPVRRNQAAARNRNRPAGRSRRPGAAHKPRGAHRLRADHRRRPAAGNKPGPS